MIHLRIPAQLRSSFSLPADAPRAERVLAGARLFLGVACLFAVYLDPSEPSRYATIAYGLLVAYIVLSSMLLLMVRSRTYVSRRLTLTVHAVDCVWPALITFYTAGPNSPFFLYFVFVMFAAAYRWGMRETLATMIVALALFLGQGLPLVAAKGGLYAQLLATDLELNRLVVRSTHLIALGILLGYLGEEQRRRLRESAVTARVLGKARVEQGLSQTMEAMSHEVMRAFGARALLITVQETSSGRVYLWSTLAGSSQQPGAIHARELDFTDRDLFLFSAPPLAEITVNRSAPAQSEAVALDERARPQPSPVVLPAGFLEQFPCARMLTVSLVVSDLAARVLLLDPVTSGSRRLRLEFAQQLISQVAPAAYNVYLLRRLRSRAGAAERARVARELHDGAIQSLIAAEMQVDVLRRRLAASAHAASQTDESAVDLARIQQLLRREVINLRELMQQIKPAEVDPKQLLEFIASSVEKFDRETGITTRFVSGLDEVTLPPRVCREIARIVQEALVNMRRHSGAHNAVVRFAVDQGDWVLSVEDDGKGFDFKGRWNMTQLEAARRGPLVIKERVRAIGGELTIESKPGEGARLEVRFPQKSKVAYV